MDISLSFEGLKPGTVGELTVLTAPDAYSMNEVGKKELVTRTVSRVLANGKGVFEFGLPDLSVGVLKT